MAVAASLWTCYGLNDTFHIILLQQLTKLVILYLRCFAGWVAFCLVFNQ